MLYFLRVPGEVMKHPELRRDARDWQDWVNSIARVIDDNPQMPKVVREALREAQTKLLDAAWEATR